jgi:hypothetical protein
VTWDGIQIFRIRCGQIAESWGRADHLGLRQQLGALPEAETPSATGPEASPGAGQATNCPNTTADENEAIARRWDDVLTSGDLGLLDDLLSMDVIFHSPVFGVVTGPEAVKRSLASLRAGYPDLRATAEEAMVEGNLVALRWSEVGTHLGEFQGIAPTGRETRWTGINLFRIACGQIAEVWVQVDALGPLERVSAQPGTPTP